MYRIYQFGSTPLPPAMPEDDLSTGEVESTLVDSVGGVYDAWGLNRRLPRRQTINLRGMFELTDNGRFPDGLSIYLVNELGDHIVDHLGNRIIVDSAVGSLWRNADALKAQMGTVQNLYRLREDDGAASFKQARLIHIGNIRTLADAGKVTHIDMVFETRQPTWRALSPTSVSAALPASLTLTNGGNLTVTDAVLTVTASGTIASPITISGNGIDLVVAIGMSTGQSLVLDSRDQTVRVNGVDHYADLTRGPLHTVAGWTPVPTGTSALSVTVGGGTGTASMAYFEQTF